MKDYLYKILGSICLVLAMTGCKEDLTASLSQEDGIKAGEPVQFSTYMPKKALTRTAQEDFETRISTEYLPVAKNYLFTVEMYKEGEADALGSATYVPATTIENEGEEDESIVYPTDGSLQLTGETALYWLDNVNSYGFRATAGSETLAADQSTEALWLQQDRLLGFGFEPVWEGDADAGQQKYNETALNYLTSKEWYLANKATQGLAPGGVDEASWYKKIPLYFQHQRSLITIRLKAGEGVTRDALKELDHIVAKIYSYDGADALEITPLGSNTLIDYTAEDFGGAEADVETSEYTAVVMPHDYLAGATSDVIAEISLSGQRFTFRASNDEKYGDYNVDDKTSDAYATAEARMQNYTLGAGKHLVITATLGRESRKIVITAYVEDWTEEVTTSVVDDYGQAGDPITISTRKELYDFLTNENLNKQGTVAIIMPSSLDLEHSEGSPMAWVPQPLNCTLNMAGATFFTSHQVFSSIAQSGNLVNGSIHVGNGTVASAIAGTNRGTIERVNVHPRTSVGEKSSAYATRAGLVEVNHGTISGCTSTLPVSGTDGFVGGIAAQSYYNGNAMPVIDGCTVDARVDGTGDTKGGGIVGEAVGRVTNNRFEYGITILQGATNFKNIIQGKYDDDVHQLRVYDNSWPTVATNSMGDSESEVNNNGTPVPERYTGVLDSQTELAYILTHSSSTDDFYRLSNDFTVTKNETTPGANDGWTYGKKTVISNSTGDGVVNFKLNGNDKTITTDAMIFSNIRNNISNLTVVLSDHLLATPTVGLDEAIAALGYAVSNNAKLSNIKVKGGGYRIQAATAGGIVVWACDGAVLEDCECKASVQAWMSAALGEDARKYSGGIAAFAAHASFTRCTYHSTTGTLFMNASDTYTESSYDANKDKAVNIFYGGIVGGTVPNGTENPSVLITDCTSWFVTPDPKVAQKGAIVGYAQYGEGTLHNGMADGCQGNWWNTNSNAVGTWLHGMTEEQVIGKRNAVDPTPDTSF